MASLDYTASLSGAFLVSDLVCKLPEGFHVKYNDDNKTLTPWMNFQWYMEAEALKIKPELGEQGKAVELTFLGVHPDYRGKGIANHLFRCVIPLVTKAGYKYATIGTTNAFSAKATKRNNFVQVFEIKASDWLWKGKPLYVNAKAPHGTWTFWMKEL